MPILRMSEGWIEPQSRTLSESTFNASRQPMSYRARFLSSSGEATPRLWRRYIQTLVLVIAAVCLRSLLNPMMGQQSAIIFLAAIIISAWMGGVGPALLSLAVLHVAHGYWFSVPPGLWQYNLAWFISTGGYYLVGIIVGVLSQKHAAATARERAQQSESIAQREQLRATLACIADGVIVTNIDGQLELMNRAAEAATGWSLAEAKGKLWGVVFSIRREGGKEEVENPIDRALHTDSVVHETAPLILASKTNQTIPVSYSAAPVANAEGEVSGVVLIFRDESQRRRAELDLKEADRRKDEFLATLAHELRNPLAPITAGLELLKLSAGNMQESEEIRLIMQRQTQHMVRLIDDLLDVSRITRGKLELRKADVDLATVVRTAVEATQSLFDAAQHQLMIQLPDEPLFLNVDAARLTQVFSNLLNNAAKFTPANGRIVVSAERSGDDVVATVTDSGVGIPADKLEQVFELFVQIHDRNNIDGGGLGIGLTLVKRLVEMHDGTIEVRSEGINLGTTFVLRFPCLPSTRREASVHAPQDTPLPTSQCKRILVVDDNADALESLSRLISSMGNDVCRATDGFEALKVGATFAPDVVLMDLGMPNLDGYQAARRLRREPWGRGLTLIATTGWGQEEDRRRSAEAGFDYHLVKPISVSTLVQIFDSVASARNDE
ncbi:MAG: hypothetical protein C0485_10310 [Pirellula sp.]|nr:hypothetical protein [Pirellula sp.]